MSTPTDISALYQEFTEALTEVLGETAFGICGNLHRTTHLETARI
jgi:hypothetical protein